MKIIDGVKHCIHKVIQYALYERKIGSHGEDIVIGKGCSFAGGGNITIGNHVQIGRNSILWSTKASLTIQDYVVMGPNVSIHTGNHEIHKLGKCVIEVPLEETNPSNFGDVVIESDVWLGDGVKILKGVRIARGSIIGAGSVVTRDTLPYGIYGGVPAKKIGDRFTTNEITEHEKLWEARHEKL